MTTAILKSSGRKYVVKREFYVDGKEQATNKLAGNRYWNEAWWDKHVVTAQPINPRTNKPWQAIRTFLREELEIEQDATA